MWIYLLGPFLSLLPSRWRKGLPFADVVHWHSASILSGMAESLLALGVLLYWYSFSVTTWVSQGLDNQLSKSSRPTTITEHEVGFAALLIWATHPLTWLIAYFAIEGVARLCAAFTDTVLCIFPLYLLDKIYLKISRRDEPPVPGAPKFSQSHVSSYVETIREKVLTARLPQVPDELCVTKVDTDEILEIRACREKPDWTPPRVIRYEDRYYRLEDCSRGPAPRPFLYKLRRLSAGVPGRTVLIYAPKEEPVIANR
jgi:hypothetical protein